MKNELKNCTLCPRNCHVNRYIEKGYCGQTNKIRIARASLHYFEEPPISGDKGSGTIFFSGCNLKCCFCQNSVISHNNYGVEISIKRLSEIMLELQDKGAKNINLVTPTCFVPQIIKAIKKARLNNLHIPIIYNSSGYENKNTIKLLKGYIDIYLPDFKYFNNVYAKKYSKANDYFEKAIEAIDEMVNQTGTCVFDKDGYLIKGTIIRHLILPSLENDTKNILKYIYDKYKDTVYISIMNQYTPPKDIEYPELKKSLKNRVYNEIIDYALSIGISNAYCQMEGTNKESFIPSFDLEGVKKKH